MPPKMGRGRGGPAAPAATMDFVDSAIQEAIVSQRSAEPPAHKMAYFDTVEGSDVLSNLYATYADDVETYEVAEVKYVVAHDEDAAHEMMMKAFAGAK